MEIETKIESERFNSALKTLVKITGASQEQVLKSEMRSMLGKAMKDTSKADRKKIIAYYDFKGLGKEQPDAVKGKVMIDGKLIWTRKVFKKGMWKTRKKGNWWDPNAINPMFKKVKAHFDRQRKYALSQIGQSKATWYHLAKKIGAKGSKLGSHNVPSFVSKLRLPRRLKDKLKINEGSELDYFVEVVNSGDTTPWANGRYALESAFKGRKDFYVTNIEKGVFKTLERTLAKYPELRVELGS